MAKKSEEKVESLTETKKKLTDIVRLKNNLIKTSNARKIFKTYSETSNSKFDLDFDGFGKVVENEYIDGIVDSEQYKILISKPHLKKEEQPKRKYMIGLIVSSILLVLGFLLAFVPSAIGYNTMGMLWLGLAMIGEFLVIGGLIAFIVYLVKFLKNNKTYKQNLATYKANVKYNQNDYPNELQTWEEQAEKIRPEFIKNVIKQNKEYESSKKELIDKKYVPKNEYDFESYLTFDQMDYVEDILKLLNENRADTLKEAINLYFREKAEEEARAKAQAELERHNAEIEEATARQTRALQAQARASETQAREAQKQTEILQKQAREQKYQNQTTANNNGIDYTKCLNCGKFKTCSRTRCTGYVPPR